MKIVDVDWEMTGNWALKRKKEKGRKRKKERPNYYKILHVYVCI